MGRGGRRRLVRGEQQPVCLSPRPCARRVGSGSGQQSLNGFFQTLHSVEDLASLRLILFLGDKPSVTHGLEFAQAVSGTRAR